MSDNAATAREFVDFSKHLAVESGKIIRQYFRADFDVEYKEDDTPVTIANRRAEEIIREIIIREIPDHGILGEEFGAHLPDARFQWVLDPVDGTKNFAAGTYLFGTLIALVDNGQPILGLINQPIVEECLIGTGDETRLDERVVQVRNCQRLEDTLLLSTSHYSVERYHDPVGYERLCRRAMRYRQWGDCHGYFLIAIGGADIMVDPAMNVWDVMALVPIIEGAGGCITDWHGNNVVGGEGAIATAGPIHEAVVRQLHGE